MFDISQQNRVFYSILKGAGKTNAGFNAKIPYMKWGGRALVVVSFAYAGYEIYNAENKEKEIYRQGVTIGGGIAGGGLLVVLQQVLYVVQARLYVLLLVLLLVGQLAELVLTY